MKKILFIPGYYPFCYYYRGYLPGVYSNQMVVSDFLRKDMQISNERVIEQSDRADIVVFQRPSDVKYIELAKLLKRKGKKVIFENDDTYSGIPLERLGNYKQKKIAKEQNKNLMTFLSIADGAVASTEILANEYRKINKNVVVLKNCIDPLDEFKCKKNDTGKFRVGFIGSVTSNDDYFHIKDQIRELDERNDITIVILGIKYKDNSIVPIMQEDADFWSSLKNVEWHPYVHVTEYMMTIASLALDVAIIPRKEHYFNQCKSNVKFLEMSLLKIPVIAQGFSDGSSPYEHEEGVYMTIVKDNSKWYHSIIFLKDHYDLAKERAELAHDYVLKNYNIKKYAKEWVKQINNLIK